MLLLFVNWPICYQVNVLAVIDFNTLICLKVSLSPLHDDAAALWIVNT